jgi:hypothetical protein
MPNPENLEGQGFHTDPNRINKEGRPKGTKNLSTILKAMLEEDVEVVIDGKKERRQFQEVIIRKLLKKANDGDLRAIMEIFDRVEGKAKQEMNITSVDLSPVITAMVDGQIIDGGMK